MQVKPKSKQWIIISNGGIERIKYGREGKNRILSAVKIGKSLSSQITKKTQLSYSGPHLTHYWSFLRINYFHSVALSAMHIFELQQQ